MDRLLPPGDVARAFGVSVRTLRRWTKAGLITAQFTLGGQRRYRESEVRDLLTAARPVS
jgi:excisionase family DNA binding protein